MDETIIVAFLQHPTVALCLDAETERVLRAARGRLVRRTH